MNNEYRGIIGRAILYFSIAFLTPLSSLLNRNSHTDTWPTMVSLVATVVAGILSGAIAIRAYFDGSAQRFTDAQKTNGNGTNNVKPEVKP